MPFLMPASIASAISLCVSLSSLLILVLPPALDGLPVKTPL
jgi:hypothetical protein